MNRKGAVSRLGVLLLLCTLLALPSAAVQAAPASAGRREGVTSANDRYNAKIHPSLRARAEVAAPNDEMGVLLRVQAGADVSRYMTWSLTRPWVDPLGLQAIVGSTKASHLWKLAALPEVAYVQPLEPLAVLPDKPDDGLARHSDRRAIVQRRLAELKAGTKPTRPVGEAGTAAWFEALDPHQLKAAWDKGFTGRGVKVAVWDSGVDFAHPDLQGTQARDTNPASPYYGWPIAFDSLSMTYWALDQLRGTSHIANCEARYADTSTVVTGTTVEYRPCGADAPRTYTTTGTSVSGRYHIGSHVDPALAAWWYGERPAVLVVDEKEAGVYDTVYVDLDHDYDFRDEKPARRGDELSYHDLDGDGFADVSGGMVYFIADGVNPVPASDWLWGLGVAGNGQWDPGEPGAGDLVAFMISNVAGRFGDHGQRMASSIVGQGIVDGRPGVDGSNPIIKPRGDGTPGSGMVVGGGKEVKLIAMGDLGDAFFGEDGLLFAALGYDGQAGTGDEAQIVVNGWTWRNSEDDGWQFNDRYYDFLHRHLNPRLSVLFSAGDDGPGLGTISSPHMASAITVGAATLYGIAGWDSASSVSQITWGDVSPLSGRGPDSRGDNGISVVASAGEAASAVALNGWGDGWSAWESWDSTSRSAAVAAANLALLYQAYRQAHGEWPDFLTAREILMSSADNLHYDPLIQGAGLVNAARATDVAAGRRGVHVSPSQWQVGDYHGATYWHFARVIFPGESDTATFTLRNEGPQDVTVQVASDILLRIGEMNFDWTTADASRESAFDLHKPDYLRELTHDIPRGTDLMVVRWVFPLEQLDPDGNYGYNQRWYVALYDWTDVDGDGKLWLDHDGDGAVDQNVGDAKDAYNELDVGELVRFAYGRSSHVGGMVAVQRPLERMHNGVFLGLIHRQRTPSVPSTNLTLKIEFYRHMPWSWLTIGAGGATSVKLTVPAHGEIQFQAILRVPDTADVGFYNGSILITDERGGSQSLIPVTVNVAASGPEFALGGPPMSRQLYDNGRFFPALSWEDDAVTSGDTRLYFFDVREGTAKGKSLLVQTRWDAPPTDLDTLLLGPTPDALSSGHDVIWPFGLFDGRPEEYGPYTLSPLARSELRYFGRGHLFGTATGGPQELVAGPLQPGLHEIIVHNVAYAGQHIAESMMGEAGTLTVEPAAIEFVTNSNRGTVPVTVSASLPLADLVVEGYGLSTPTILRDQVARQDDPSDPCTASYRYTFSVAHGGRLKVAVANMHSSSDVDLYLYHDANGDGTFDCPGEQIGASSTAGDAEFIAMTLPPDGEYLVAVHGWSVPEEGDTFDLTIDVVQGSDLSVSGLAEGPYAAHVPLTFNLDFEKEMEGGQTYAGVLLLGPEAAPGVLAIPLTIHRQHATVETLSLEPVQDTYINAWSPDNSAGSEPILAVRQQDVQAALVQFDLSAIDPSYPVDSAILSIYATTASNVSALDLGVYELLADWREDAASWNAADLGVPWEVPGASGTADRAEAAVAEVTVSGSGWHSLDITELVRKWVAQPASNHGLILRGIGSEVVEYDFASSNHPMIELHPVLTVHYRSP